jgi:TonB-linked SusC/RagA family outer membrane protein
MMTLFQINANNRGNTLITLHKTEVKVEKMLSETENLTEFEFFLDTKNININRKLSVRSKKKSRSPILRQLFSDRNLIYGVFKKGIILKTKSALLPNNSSLSLDQQKAMQLQVSGTLTDSNGTPIPAVNILEKNTNNGTQADFDGKYSIEVTSADAVLVFTFVGLKTAEISLSEVPIVNGQATLDLQLKEDPQSLDEVVVVGYGKQKKISIVGAISTLKPEKLRNPTANISNSLAGNLSGVIAFQRSGEPGADASSFFIRGISTFSGAQNPLILLDGVEISSGDLSSLAPEIIESISVLKDASATAIYGTRGANGVLIVTTKEGKNLEKPRIFARVQSQISFPTSTPNFVDGVEYMELFNEGVTQRQTGEILYPQDKIDGTRQGLDRYVFPNVDWYDELFNEATYNQEANVNIQGGGKKVGYFMSATLNKSTGLLKNSDLNSYDSNISVKSFSFQNNINADLSPTTSISLKLNTNLRYYGGPSNSAGSVYGNVVNANPVDFPATFPDSLSSDPRDILYGGKSGSTNGSYINPFAILTEGYSENFQSTVLATVNGEQKLNFIADGLSFKGLVSFKNWSTTTVNRTRGYNQYQTIDLERLPGDAYDYQLELIGSPSGLSLGTGTGTGGDRNLYFQPSIEYNSSFGKHDVTGLLLYNQTEFVNNSPEDLISSLARRRQGYAGRLTYGYNDIYLFEANFGYNGSENFAKGKRFGFFPSFGAGYVISNESYFSSLKESINLLKIRANWGKVGNDQIGGARFPYLSNINLTGRNYTTGVEQNTTYYGPSYLQFANNNIGWETANKFNIGLDVGLFNQFNLVVDFYNERRTNIFVDISSTIPDVFGTSGTAVYSNIGEVLNQGVDASIQYNKQIGGDFHIAATGTFTYAHNEIIKNSEPAFTEFPNLSEVGHSIGSHLGYVAERLFIDQAEVDSSPVQQLGGFVSAGDIKYKDITGDGLINSDDRVRMGDPGIPEIVYGISTTINYKAFDFSFLFQGVAKTSFYINGFHPFGSQGARNVLQFIADDHYSPQNPDIYAGYPKLSKLDNNNNTENSTFWLKDGSFLKLRSAEIGYNYKFARFFLSGYNLWTFSKFKKWDPEQGGGNGLGYPTQTIANLGVQLRFN